MKRITSFLFIIAVGATAAHADFDVNVDDAKGELADLHAFTKNLRPSNRKNFSRQNR